MEFMKVVTLMGLAGVFVGVVAGVPLVRRAVFADFYDNSFVEIEFARGTGHFRNHFVDLQI